MIPLEKLCWTTSSGWMCCQVLVAPRDPPSSQDSQGTVANWSEPLQISTFAYPITGVRPTDEGQVGSRVEHAAIQGVTSTRVVLPYQPDMGSTLSRFVTRGGDPHFACPRTALEQVVGKMSKEGLRFLVGVELEFTFFEKNGTGFAAQGSLASSPLITAVHHKPSVVVKEAVLALRTIGITIYKYHTENRAGKFEIALQPLSPLNAADGVLRVREVVRDIADKHGLVVSFAPWLEVDVHQSNGIHYHISRVNNRKNKPLPKPLPYQIGEALLPEERSFAAGILKHLVALRGITMPHSTSYGRQRHAGLYRCWSSEIHVGCGLRLCFSLDEEHRPTYRWEYRAADAIADSHLSLAAILAAGGQGILDKATLDYPDVARTDGWNVTQALTEGGKAAKDLGADEALPKTLEESLQALADDELLSSMLGKDLVELHIGARREHSRLFDEKPATEQQTYLRQLY